MSDLHLRFDHSRLGYATSTPMRNCETLSQWGFSSPTSMVNEISPSNSFSNPFYGSSSSSSTSSSSSVTSSSPSSVPHYQWPSSPMTSFTSSNSSSSYHTASAMYGTQSQPSGYFCVQFGQPFENLFDQFDNDPSYRGMLRYDAFVMDHFQQNTYGNRNANKQKPQSPREPCNSSISSLSSFPNPERRAPTNPSNMNLNPFSIPDLSTSIAEKETSDDSDYDHWF